MPDFGTYGDVGVVLDDDFVATAEIRRPPHNYFDLDLIDSLAAAFGDLDAEPGCRAVVLCSEGKNFCAGARHDAGPGADPASGAGGAPRHLYDAAVDLYSTSTPAVAAVQGAAVGGGLGLACFADFRVAAPQARFSANFARLGFHHGFGLTVSLPAIVGRQQALELLYTGRRVKGDEAVEIGLADRAAPLESVRAAAHGLAAEIAASAPLAVASIRRTMRGHLPAAIRAATDHEKAEQDRLRRTADWAEGVSAMGERRTPEFRGA
ncbi:MAG TPA: enoyl-CoA hydratase [Acidimicrobiaceae bacterium]|nr:enoyl-CoA hydratase [Acidimicrobiaceae bacterium]HCB37584.1 enoyl-CoA hydratase [Acidimicrobiaceae bacterium]